MSIKLIALDMDGTLVDSTHVRISEKNKTILQKCMKEGIHVVFATGRPLNLMKPLAQEIGIRYAITANGSGVWDIIDEKMLIGRTIPAADADKILKLLDNIPGMPVEVYYDGAAHVDKRTWNFDNYQLQPRSFLDERAKYNVFHDNLVADALGHDVEKFNIDGMPCELYDEAVAELRLLVDDDAVCDKTDFKKCEEVKLTESTSNENYKSGGSRRIADNLDIHYNAKYENLEISRADAVKGDALADLCKMLGVMPEEVMAFGDSDNDLSMLEFAGESYAVANATDGVKKACKHVTLSNDDDGVAEAILKTGII